MCTVRCMDLTPSHDADSETTEAPISETNTKNRSRDTITALLIRDAPHFKLIHRVRVTYVALDRAAIEPDIATPQGGVSTTNLSLSFHHPVSPSWSAHGPHCIPPAFDINSRMMWGIFGVEEPMNLNLHRYKRLGHPCGTKFGNEHQYNNNRSRDTITALLLYDFHSYLLRSFIILQADTNSESALAIFGLFNSSTTMTVSMYYFCKKSLHKEHYNLNAFDIYNLPSLWIAMCFIENDTPHVCSIQYPLIFALMSLFKGVSVKFCRKR
ncbi:hypothetical protein K439DRAFT_1615435 [Ramaria rubella]|nr:hypothetical protein K439DRAFT_1615435 [Ramaria rubella]